MKRVAQTVQTVLVVDDDPEWLDFLSKVIGSEYPVLSATNGEDALYRAQRTGPDLIILDVMMPGKDGFATFAELLRDPETCDIPVMMLTDVNRRMGLAFGAENMNLHLGKAPAAFLSKPISADRLLAEVRKVLEHGRLILKTAL